MATPRFAPFLQPNALAKTTREFGRELRDIRSAEATAIAAAQGAALDRQAKTQQVTLQNAPAISDRFGGEFLTALGASGLAPGDLAATREFADRSANLGRQNIFAEGFEKIAGGASDFTDAGQNLSSLETRRALAGEIPNFRQGLTKIQGDIASSAAGATKVRTPVAVARDKLGNVIGFGTSMSELRRELSTRELDRDSYTIGIEFPDTTASGGQIGTSVPVSGAGGGGKPPPASDVDTPAGDEAQPEGTGGDPSVLNATDPPQQRIAEDEARAAQGQPLTTGQTDIPLATVNTTPVPGTTVEQVEATLRANTVATIQLDNGETITITPVGDGKNVLISGGGRGGKETVPIEEITRRIIQAQSGQ